ncbi:MAG: YggS family pyridoxal phosphate-dependent enzyme, partial [bacterium]
MTHVSTPPQLADRIAQVRGRSAEAAARGGRTAEDVTLIAVTKTWPASTVLEALGAGLTQFGENRVQEGVSKAAEVAALQNGLPVWHLIGHLQTNKVRAALGTFSLLHSVDSERLLRAISSAAESPVPLMIEVNVANEPTKFGISPASLPALLEVAVELPHVSVEGLMTVAPRAVDSETARPVFCALRELADRHKLKELSMGMT